MSKQIIYKVLSYRTKIDKCIKIEDDILTICKYLNIDNCYHERIYENDIVKLNIDLDGESIENFKLNFNEYFLNIIKLKDSDYLYTTNFNKKDSNNNIIPSHHVIIKNYHCKSSVGKQIFEDFKTKYYLENNHIIDTSHLGAKGSGHWFRLPNQTKEKRSNTEHKIINGEIKDFILKYIPSDSINLDNLFIVKVINKKNKILNNNIEYKLSDSDSIEEKLFYLLNDKYFSNWTKWSNLCFIIYNLKFSFELFNNLSKKCPSKYTYDACLDCWNKCKLNTKPFSIGLIHYLARTNNPEEYHKLMELKNNEEISLVESNVISTRYLELSPEIIDYLNIF